MTSKQKEITSFISLSKPASKKLVGILSAPQTPQQKESIQRSTGSYSYYSEKWMKK